MSMLIALHRGEGWIARAIRWQTRSVYSHASIVLEDSELVIEAREFQGVRVVMWRDVVASGERVDLFRVKGMTEEAEETVREFLWEQMGKAYDYTMVARFISRRQEERASSGKWFCSELVFAALAKAGVRLLERIEAWEVSPGVLRLSTRLEEVEWKPQNTRNTRTGRIGEQKAGCTGGPIENFQRSEINQVRMHTLCYASPLTPALSPLRGEGEDILGVSTSSGIACESGQVGKGSTPTEAGAGSSRPTGMEGAGEGACTTMEDGGVCPTTRKEADYVR